MQEELIQEQIAEITALLESGRKIEAIKQVREYTGLGLAEAKDMVEKLERSQGLGASPRGKALKSSGCGAVLVASVLFVCAILSLIAIQLVF